MPNQADSTVARPQPGPVTQGTVFCCAVAEDYPGCAAHGLIITARCDAANDKIQTYNYIPIVSLNDWLHRDGRIILSSRLMAETIGGLKAVLKEGGYSVSILETETPRSVLCTLFPSSNAVPKAVKVQRAHFDELCARHELAASGILSAPPNAVCLQIAKVAPGLKDSLLKELAHQRLTGYYFLNRVDPDGEDFGYVALLREIQTMPRRVAHALAEGLDSARFAEMCSAEPELRGRLCIARDDLAMPVGLLRSPNLEHLMQSFALLFSRIGIDDPDPSYVAGLWMRQRSVAEVP